MRLGALLLLAVLAVGCAADDPTIATPASTAPGAGTEPGSPSGSGEPDAGPRSTESTDALDVAVEVVPSSASGVALSIRLSATGSTGVAIPEPGNTQVEAVDEDGVAVATFDREPYRLHGDEAPATVDTYGIAADTADHVLDDLVVAVPDDATAVQVCFEVLPADDDVETGEVGSTTGYTDDDGPARLACSDPVELPRR